MFASCLLAACGGGGTAGDDGDDDTGNGDGGGNPDAGPPLPVCVQSCGTAADCATGTAGSFLDADNYTCDGGVCTWRGCLSTAECVTTYGTQAWTCEQAFGAATPTCWPTCTDPAQCAVAGSPLYDANNYACDGGKCHWVGCNDTSECTAANNSSSWTCIARGSAMKQCWRTCNAPADCATASAPYDADNYTCESNLCIWHGCNTTAECSTIDPDWVCD